MKITRNETQDPKKTNYLGKMLFGVQSPPYYPHIPKFLPIPPVPNCHPEDKPKTKKKRKAISPMCCLLFCIFVPCPLHVSPKQFLNSENSHHRWIIFWSRQASQLTGCKFGMARYTRILHVSYTPLPPFQAHCLEVIACWSIERCVRMSPARSGRNVKPGPPNHLEKLSRNRKHTVKNSCHRTVSISSSNLLEELLLLR